MSQSEIQKLVDAVNARYTDPERNVVIKERSGEQPRFELYHFSLSVCSHKLRAVLDEKEVSYFSHDINILPPDMQNYYPEYVRLRLAANKDLNDRMVNDYTGRSSTETEGFDPCVVPTLIDHEVEKILVNSKYVCTYLNSVISTGTDLVPDDIADEVMRQVDIVDRTPHPAVLYGVNPDGDKRPDFIQAGMNGIHDLKIGEARANMAQAGDDALLISAYEHKIKKEAAARQHVLTEQKMRASIQEIKDIVAELESDIQKNGGEWVIGDQFTLADIQWAASLFRIQWLGLGDIWETKDEIHLPKVAQYTKRLYLRPSFQRAVIHWPRNPPSPHVMEYYK